MMKESLKGLMRLFGLEVRRVRHDAEAEGAGRGTLRGALAHAKSLGLAPRTVIDVGAADGTHELYDLFPDANHLLIEPLEEFESCLKELVARLPRSQYVLAAAAGAPGYVTLNVHEDLVGSSMYREGEDSDVNGVPRQIPAVTLDEVCAAKDLPGPYLVKVDVQGAELDALRGADRVLRDAGCVVLETSMFRFFEGAPDITDVLDWMRSRGFAPYDIVDTQYRLLDNAMSQVDVVFVKDSGPFRRCHWYADREQRGLQDARLAAARQEQP